MYKRLYPYRQRFTVRRPELKHADTPSETINVTSAGVFGSIVVNGITQGISALNRIGDRVIIKKVGLRFSMTPTDTTDDGDVVRIILLVDHQPNGANPAVLDILQTADEQSFRQIKSLKRFTFLMDKYVSWSVNSRGTGADPTVFAVDRTAFTFWRDLNLECEYDGNGATITSISTNAIHMFAISNQANDTTILWSSRVSYTDF